MSNRQKSGNSIGISLILIVFILLCLITFGTLSFLLTSRDNELSQSSAENIIEFYQADMAAQQQLKDIDQNLREIYQETESEEEYIESVSEIYTGQDDVQVLLEEERYYLVYDTEVSDKEILVSTIEICYPVEEGYYRIESWVLVNINNE